MAAITSSTLSALKNLSLHVKDDEKVSKISNFIDLLWDFSNEVSAPNSKKNINWASTPMQNKTMLSDPCNKNFYITLKEYAFSRISGRGPTLEYRNIKIQTIIDDIGCLYVFARWLATEGKSSFSEATQRDLDRYVEWLQHSKKRRGQGPRTPAYIVRCLLPISTMWLHQKQIDNGLSFSPWNGRAATRVLNYQNPDNNRTEIIPDNVMLPLYQLSIRLIQPDVIDPMIRVLRQTPPPLPKYALSSLERTNRRNSFTKLKKQLKRHKLFGNFGEKGSEYYNRWSEIEADVGIIYAAFTVIIAGLSAMRDSEVRSLTPKAAKIEYDSAKQPKTYKLIGRTFKNASEDISDEIGGEERTWVVIQEVYDAVVALEKFAVADPAFDQVRLFSRIQANSTVNTNLRRLLALTKSSNDTQSYVTEGSQWQLKSSQFRRSLARWVVWQPFGIVAGKNLFGHARISTTQGYAASDQSWNKLVAKEEAMLIDDVMIDLAYDVSEGAVTGIKSKEILELFGTAGDRRFDDVLFYLKHSKKNFHVGPYSYCFYDPDRAACKPFATKDNPKVPVTSSCSPDRCANACISRRHLPAWQILAGELDSMMRTKGLNETQKQVLLRERIRIDSVIHPLLNEVEEPTEDNNKGVQHEE